MVIFKNLMVCLLGCLFMASAHAIPVAAGSAVLTEEEALLKAAVVKYYQKMAQEGSEAKYSARLSLTHFDRERCDDRDEDRYQSCQQAACAQPGASCNYSSGLENMIKLCRGVDGGCVTDVCKQPGASCNYSSGLETVIKMCKDVRGSCVKTICSFGGASCNYSSGLENAVKLCNGTDYRCVKDSCSQPGASCNYSSGLENIVKLCRR